MATDLCTTGRAIADAIAAHIDAIASGDISTFELFGAAYGPLPVHLAEGQWICVDSDTGVSEDEVPDHDIRTLAELAARLNLEPWSLACNYGWADSEIDADEFIVEHGLCDLAQQLAEARHELELQRQEAEEEYRCMVEDQEIIEAEQAELRAIDRGEGIVYCSAASLEDAADEIGMPADSQTARLYWERKLHRAEAERRAEIIRHRHEDTDYDALLARGLNKEDARALASE